MWCIAVIHTRIRLYACNTTHLGFPSNIYGFKEGIKVGRNNILELLNLLLSEIGINYSP